jgi:hypothetical protein
MEGLGLTLDRGSPPVVLHGEQLCQAGHEPRNRAQDILRCRHVHGDKDSGARVASLHNCISILVVIDEGANGFCPAEVVASEEKVYLPEYSEVVSQLVILHEKLGVFIGCCQQRVDEWHELSRWI